MPLPSRIECVKNERTDKYFVVLDWDQEAAKASVINPNGDALDVTLLIFQATSRQTIESSSYAKFFSEAQIQKLNRYDEEMLLAKERKKAEKKPKASAKVKASKPAKEATAKVKRSKPELIKSNETFSGQRSKVQWESQGLVFYRHKIEQLSASDIFEIKVENVGSFKISKAEFLRSFNNVVMDAEYRGNGVFSYKDVPDTALKFMSKP